MELLETQDPEKRKLLETSNRHRQEMEREIKDISEKSEKVLKNALIIGGALALTYIVVNQLSSKSKKKKSRKDKEIENLVNEEPVDEGPSLLSQMGDKALNMATVLLLDLAKEKLSEYLQHRKSKDEDS
ncbi:MAG TPA: hypothetical protein VGQ59_10370 [Cyclobacteriaceae bacterium]|jgi:hypothetical protein|nr:hypothetical protein [Cyclobacteriaceae bacterium]